MAYDDKSKFDFSETSFCLSQNTPYKKKAKKKKNKKSDHKHEYYNCILEDGRHAYKANYCIKCGHIYTIYFFLNPDDKDLKILPKFRVNDIWKIWKDKNIPLQE